MHVGLPSVRVDWLIRNLYVLMATTLTTQKNIFTVHGVTEALWLYTGSAAHIPIHKVLVQFQVRISSANLVIFLLQVIIIDNTTADLVYQITIAQLLVLLRWETGQWLLVRRSIWPRDVLQAWGETCKWWLSLHFLLETVLACGFKFAHSCPRRENLLRWIVTRMVDGV